MSDKKVFQVALPVHNSSKTVLRCLDSINGCLSGEEWHLVVGDNGSTDDTLKKIKDHVKNLSCESEVVMQYSEAKNDAEAKNRVLSICGAFSENRPYVLGMDASSVMLPARVRLIDHAVDMPPMQSSKCSMSPIVGPWRYSMSQKEYEQGKYQQKDIQNLELSLGFTWAATILPAAIIPQQGKLFKENLNCYEDIIYWHELRYQNAIIDFIWVDGEDVYHHVDDPKKYEKQKQYWQETHDLIEALRNTPNQNDFHKHKQVEKEIPQAIGEEAPHEI